jgi:1,4-alpha-glucan branching enzyme
MPGYFAPVLHAHLPFVRHPEHDRFLEENWLFEAITESYLPLLRVMEGWLADGLETRLTLTLTPTLCSMLLDPLLQQRYRRYIDGLVELAEKETHRTLWDPALQPLALFYLERFRATRAAYLACDGNLVGAFRRFQDLGRIEIITSAATHALLPLLRESPPSLRAQILVARDHYRACFGRDPRGIWLPECAYVEAVEPALQEAGIRWFLTETHGILHARPRPRYGTFAPVFTPNGIAAFGRDFDSARQVWSRNEGYPGDPCYRDFYRDIGFDLDFDYLKPHLSAPPNRGFTGIKYYAITGGEPKRVYDRNAAVRQAAGHARHFLDSRVAQMNLAAATLDRPPVVVAPYDAELFGHWWYEGPEFLDCFFRMAAADPSAFRLVTPDEYLRKHPTQQVATPGESSWGEEGYWKVWLNETNEWMYRHLQISQERMTELVRRHPQADGLTARALKQAAREILLAQSSDWPFILRTGTSPDYARQRFKSHLLRFLALHEQLTSTRVDEAWLAQVESQDNLFPDVDYRYWA